MIITIHSTQAMIALRLPPPICSSSCPLAPTRYYNPHSTASITANRKESCRFSKKVKAVVQPAQQEDCDEEEEGDFQVLTAVQTCYNHIVIVDTSESRLLLLDSTHNVHSVLNKANSKWTGSIWDEFAALPPIVPLGPIAIFGLAGGTAAHLMLDLWPSLQLEGWEIDKILIEKSRDYFGLSELEKHTIEGGVLNVHIGDVFSQEAAIHGGYAGIIVDLFAEGKVLPQLQQAATWLELRDKLMPGGRFMVNCGAGEDALPAENGSSMDGSWNLNATIRALCEAFPGQVNWKKLPKGAGENYVALTGGLPDLSAWSAALPSELKSSVNQWRTCNIH